jgi:hypothetical protein
MLTTLEKFMEQSGMILQNIDNLMKLAQDEWCANVVMVL